MLTRSRKALAVAGAAVCAALLCAPAIASPTSSSPAASSISTSQTAVDGGLPSPAVEDFAYPNAASILKDKGIKLIKGDGHVTWAECNDSIPQIKVLTVKGEQADRQGAYCFQANAKTGYLTLELPHVLALETTDHPISANLTTPDSLGGASLGPTQTVNVEKNGYRSVGEGVVGETKTVLVELRVTG